MLSAVIKKEQGSAKKCLETSPCNTKYIALSCQQLYYHAYKKESVAEKGITEAQKKIDFSKFAVLYNTVKSFTAGI